VTVVVIDAPEGLPTVRLEASAGGVAPVAVTVGDRALGAQISRGAPARRGDGVGPVTQVPPGLPPEPVAEPVAPQSLATRAVRSFLWAGLSFGSSKLIVFLVTLVLARLLAPADFGVVAVGLTLIAFLEIALDLGVGAAVVQQQERGITERVRTATPSTSSWPASSRWRGCSRRRSSPPSSARPTPSTCSESCSCTSSCGEPDRSRPPCCSATCASANGR
jgi:hypothetical protein